MTHGLLSGWQSLLKTRMRACSTLAQYGKVVMPGGFHAVVQGQSPPSGFYPESCLPGKQKGTNKRCLMLAGLHCSKDILLKEKPRRGIQPSRAWLLSLINGVLSTTPALRSPKPGTPASSIFPGVTGSMATRTSVGIMVNELPVSEKKPFIHRRSRPLKDESRMCPAGRCIPRAWLTDWKGQWASYKYLHAEKCSQCPHFHLSRALLATNMEKWGY